MNLLRQVYRNPFVEIVLLCAVLVQIISGLKLFRINRSIAKSNFEQLHIWTGLYLAVFFIIHVSAVLGGRFLLHLDTNFYFGVAGLNAFPSNIFFIPYYALAIISFFGHVASVHSKKMKRTIFGLTANRQAEIIFVFGIPFAVLIFYGLTNHFRGIDIPEAYN